MSLIELRDIRKTYHLGEVDLQVLKGVSLAIEKGELVALMGASGSGKSTLMNIGSMARKFPAPAPMTGPNCATV